MPFIIQAQFPPSADMEGTTAIAFDDEVFVSWAQSCEVERGWQNIMDESLGKVISGNEINATGQADNSTISLGDAGIALLTFNPPIMDGEGADFAVFENSFNHTFLELAFVEVSSDGEQFFRFPASSLTTTDEQVNTFGEVEATAIHNLAGKYQGLFGTPFDLAEMDGISGLNTMAITHLRIVDAIGSIDENFASFDAENRVVNDPFPTAFPSGGFDLDAVGVIHQTSTSMGEQKEQQVSFLEKNIYSKGEEIRLKQTNAVLYSIDGRFLHGANEQLIMHAPHQSGIYFIVIQLGNSYQIEKFIVH